MIKILRVSVMLISAVAIAHLAQAQPHPLSADFAMTYTIERAKVATVDCGCFWLQGGSLDAAVPLFRGLDAAATFTGEHSSDITSGVDLSKLAFMAGPRYTYAPSRWVRRFLGSRQEPNVFGDALFGVAHGFDGVFTTAREVVNRADTFSMEFGGGVDVPLKRGFGVRAIEVDYVRTAFQNFASNSQNDLRLAFGVTYHVRGR